MNKVKTEPKKEYLDKLKKFDIKFKREQKKSPK